MMGRVVVAFVALALALVPASLAAAQSATPTPLPGVALQAGAHPVGQPSGASIEPSRWPGRHSATEP